MQTLAFKTQLFLIRHGQPVLQNTLLGSTDSPLSDLGWSQLQQTTKQLKNIETTISSPLRRCADFAQQYAADNNLKLTIKKDFCECHFGDWDGLSFQLLHKKYPQALTNFFNTPNQHMPPHAEALLDFSQRVENTLMEILTEYKGKQIAVFTHAGVIRTLLAWCLKMDYAIGLHFKCFAINYGCISHISIYHNEISDSIDTKQSLFPQLISLNQSPLNKSFTSHE